MNSRYLVVSGALFGVIALVQLYRAVTQLPVQIGSVEVPVWVSWVAAVVTGGLCTWVFASRKR
jgi:hypothetical protein